MPPSATSTTFAPATELRSYRVADFAALAECARNNSLAVLDVRQHSEFSDSRIAGALNIPLHELLGRIDEVPGGEVWVHCASGYRASIAASLIDRPGRIVILVDDDYDNAEKLDLAT